MQTSLPIRQNLGPGASRQLELQVHFAGDFTFPFLVLISSFVNFLNFLNCVSFLSPADVRFGLVTAGSAVVHFTVENVPSSSAPTMRADFESLTPSPKFGNYEVLSMTVGDSSAQNFATDASIALPLHIQCQVFDKHSQILCQSSNHMHKQTMNLRDK